MKKVKAKDLILDSDIKVSSLKKSHNLVKYFDVLIAIIGVLSATYVFISSYDIVHNKFLVVSFIIFFVLLFSFIFKKIKILKYTLLGSIVIYVVAFYMFYDYIRYGFMATWNIVAEVMSRNLMMDVFTYDISIKNESFYISIFLIFIAYIISALICYSIIYKPNCILLLIITVPILEIGIYFNNMPSYSSFTLLVITWVSVFGMRTIQNKGEANKYKLEFKNKGKKHTYIVKGINRVITSRVGIILGLIAAIIIGMTFTIYPPSTYEPTDNVQDLRAELDKIINNFTFEKFIDDLMGVGQGGVSGGELGTIGKIKYKNETALEVTTPYFDKDIYLRGYIGCEYTGNSWEELSDEMYHKYMSDYEGIDGFNINEIMISILNNIEEAKNLKNYSAEISIKNINANKKYLYVPYNASSEVNDGSGMDTEKQRESFEFFLYNLSTYSFSYFPSLSDIDTAQEAAKYINDYNESAEGRDTTSQVEKKYKDFAYEAYTILPEEGLLDIKNKYSGRYNETKDINSCITEAITAVNDGTSYDLSPGKLPEGKDFVEYFLNENKKGYCTHFASAATVILRAMGVPARYVEGYVIKKNDADNAISTEDGTVRQEIKRPVTKEDIDNGINVSKMTNEDGSWSYLISSEDGSIDGSSEIFNEGVEGDRSSSSSKIQDGKDKTSGIIVNNVYPNKTLIITSNGNEQYYTYSSDNKETYSYNAIYNGIDGNFTESDVPIVIEQGNEQNKGGSVDNFQFITTIDGLENYSYNAENQLIDEKTGKVITMTANQKVSCNIKTMDIKDTNAHAWVEVYIDNLGWIPIEVTPGYNDESESVSAPIIEKKEDPTTTKPTEVTSKPEENTTETIVKNETVIDNNATDVVNNSIGSKILKLLIMIVIILLVIFAVIVLRHKIIITNRTRSFSTKDNNKNAHNYYRYLMDIYKYAGIYNEDNLKTLEHAKIIEGNYPFIEDGEFQEIINIVFKADFSQHKISIDELDKVISFINKLNDEIYNSLSKIQKLNYTYLKNLR